MKPETRGALVGILLIFSLMWGSDALGCYWTGVCE